MSGEWQPSREQVVALAGLRDCECFVEDICGHTSKDFHRRIQEHVERNRFGLVMIPTGHGKTQMVTIDMVCREAIRNPNVRILVVAHGATYVYELSDEIRQTLGSREIRSYYGDLVGSPWTRDKINLSHRTSRSKEPTIQFVGAGQDIEGGHFDWIILDDVVTRAGAASETERKKLKAWFFTVLMKRIDPTTKVTVIGTRYNPLDLYGVLMGLGRTVLGRVAVLRMGALLLDGAVADPALSPEELTELDRQGRLTTLWPREEFNGRTFGFTVQDMIAERESDGPVFFGLARQNSVELARGSIFQGDTLGRRYREEPDPDRVLAVFSGVDPPVTKRDTADFYANIGVAVTRDGRVYILPDMVIDRRGMRAMVDVTIERHLSRRARYPRASHLTLMESVGAQEWLWELVQEEFEHRPELRAQYEARTEFEPVRPDRDKTARGWRLSNVFSTRPVYFPDTLLGNRLAENLLQFPDVEHDDDFDALEYALNLARKVEYARVADGIAVPPNPGAIDGYEFEEMMAAKYAARDGEDESDFEGNWWFCKHND